MPGDHEIAAFLRKYDSIPADDRMRLPWEAIALSASINFEHLTGAIMFALQANSVNRVKVIALTNHPKVMKKTAEYAMLPSGEKDRATMHQGLGFLQSPKGPTFIGKAVFGPSGGKADIEDDDETETQPAFVAGDHDIDALFPPADKMQERLVPIRQKLLEAKN